MARRITHPKGVIHAKAEGSDDDVIIAFDDIKVVSAKAVCLRIDGDKCWIPFSQLVDLLPRKKEAIVTEWIAGEKGLV